MPAYTFEAIDAQGTTRKGVMEAETAKSARSLLRDQALVPILVEPVSAGTSGANGTQGSGLGTVLFASRVFGSTELAIWTRQMAGLVSSWLPLERALSSLTDEAEDERQRNLVAA